MAIPSLLGSYIDETYQRIVQTNGTRTEFADGLGNPISFLTSNTATGSYGSFYDTGSYMASSATTAYSMSLNTTDISNGVFVSGSGDPNNTIIKFVNAGVYNFQFGAQFTNGGNFPANLDIWLRRNGVDLDDTTGVCTVPASHAGRDGSLIASWNYFINVAPNDYIQLMWHAPVANTVTLATVPAGTTPINPRTPAVIVTANRVDQFLSNTGSFSGSFNGSHTGTFSGSLFGTSSWAMNALTASYVANASSFPYTGSAVITGSLSVTGSLNVTGSITGSLFGTGSWAVGALTASKSTISSSNANVSYYVPFVNQTGSQALQIDTAGTTLLYNPFTAVLSVGGGSMTAASFLGNATSATTAVSATTATTATTAATSSYPIEQTANSGLRSSGMNAGLGASDTQSVYLGTSAGNGATFAHYATMIGSSAGLGMQNGQNAVVIGPSAGSGMVSGRDTVLLGNSAGGNALYVTQSVFIGLGAGGGAHFAGNSNFIGVSAGNGAVSASYSNFIGWNAATTAVSASYSNIIGYKAGYVRYNDNAPNAIGSNNIIIGTNITLANGRKDSINIGGVIFGTGSYNIITNDGVNAYSGSIDGKIGINEVNPTYNFQVSGSVGFPNLVPSASVTNVVTINPTTGQLYYTASSAISTNTGSLITTASVSGTTITFTKGNGNTFPITVDTGSLITTASVSLNTITFTKGNGSTFPITVNTGSGGGGGGTTFPYSGSAQITGSLGVTGSLQLLGGSIKIDIPSKVNGYVLTTDAAGNATWQSAGAGAAFPYNGNAVITGSLLVSGSTGGLRLTGSFSQNASTASFGGLVNIGDSTSFLKVIPRWYGYTNAVWLDMSVDGPSAIGHGGPGANVWIGYAAGYGQYFTNAAPGDIVYRNSAGRLLFGNTGGNAGMALWGDKLGIGTVNPNYKLEVAGTVALPNLSTSTSPYVVGIDNTTGELYIQSAGGGTAATVEQINEGVTTNRVTPENQEQSKYTTINIYNYLNFS